MLDIHYGTLVQGDETEGIDLWLCEEGKVIVLAMGDCQLGDFWTGAPCLADESQVLAQQAYDIWKVSRKFVRCVFPPAFYREDCQDDTVIEDYPYCLESSTLH